MDYNLLESPSFCSQDGADLSQGKKISAFSGHIAFGCISHKCQQLYQRVKQELLAAVLGRPGVWSLKTWDLEMLLGAHWERFLKSHHLPWSSTSSYTNGKGLGECNNQIKFSLKSLLRKARTMWINGI